MRLLGVLLVLYHAGFWHDAAPSHTKRAGVSLIETIMRSSGIPVLRLLFSEMALASCVLTSSERPARIEPSIVSISTNSIYSLQSLVRKK